MTKTVNTWRAGIVNTNVVMIQSRDNFHDFANRH